MSGRASAFRVSLLLAALAVVFIVVSMLMRGPDETASDDTGSQDSREDRSVPGAASREALVPPIDAGPDVNVLALPVEEGHLDILWRERLPSTTVRDAIRAHLTWSPCADGETVDREASRADDAIPCVTSPAGSKLIWTGKAPESEIGWAIDLCGFTVARGVLAADAQRREAFLDCSGWPALHVSVQDDRGRAVSSATVRVWMSAGERSGSLEAACEPGRTTFAPLSPECIYRVEVEASGFAPFLSPELVFAPGAHTHEVVARMDRSVHAQGRVVDHAGQPVARCRVELVSTRDRRTTETDGDGMFGFEDVRVGAARFVTRHADHPTVSRHLDLDVSGKLIVLELPSGELVSGLVVDASAAPLSGEPLYVVPVLEDPAACTANARTAVTDATGSFRAGPFPAGCVVTVSSVLTGATVSTRAGQSCTLSLAVKKPVKFDAILRDARTGEPLPGPSEMQLECGPLKTGSGIRNADADGLVRISGSVVEGVPAILHVRKAGFDDLAIELPSTPIVAPVPCALVAVSVDPFGIVCVDDLGHPLPGVTLRLRREVQPGEASSGDIASVASEVFGAPRLLQKSVLTDASGASSVRIGSLAARSFAASFPGHYAVLGSLDDDVAQRARIVLARPRF